MSLNALVVSGCYFHDKPGGAARVALDMARALISEGWSVTYFCMSQDERDSREVCPIERIEVVRFASRSTIKLDPTKLLKLQADIRGAARRHISDRRWDLVHIHDPVVGSGLVSIFPSDTRIVTTVHSPITLEQEVNWQSAGIAGRVKLQFALPTLRRLERRLLSRSSGLHCLSEFVRSQIYAIHGKMYDPVVIPHWSDEFPLQDNANELRSKLGWDASVFTMFTVRQLRPRYGVEDAIRALAELRDSLDFHFFVAGEGPHRGTLEREIARSGLQDRVTLLGRVSDEDLHLMYQAADLFVLPTRALECFGLIILEALSRGCNVLATDAGAIPEVLTTARAGVVVPAAKPEELQLEIAKAISQGRPSFEDRVSLSRKVASAFGSTVILPRLLSILSPEAQCTDGHGVNSILKNGQQ